jgi:hypothetical protein
MKTVDLFTLHLNLSWDEGYHKRYDKTDRIAKAK